MTYSSDRLDQTILKTVIQIETAPNEKGDFEIGSGFLVTATEDTSGKIYLVTNKHIIGDWNYADGNVWNYHPHIEVCFYRENDPSGQVFRSSKVTLTNGAALDTTKVHLHSSPAIDLVMIDVSDIVRDPSQHISYTVYAPSYFVLFENIQTHLTSIADEVIALGYPLGIRSLRNNYPIAKIGTLASTPGEEVSIPIQTLNRAGTAAKVSIDGKFLVVDGLIVPGNSGGPVVLAGGTRVRRDPKTNQLQFADKPIQNHVVGIVSYGLGGGLTAVISSNYLVEMFKNVNSQP